MDYIYIIDKNKNRLKMELVFSFKLPGYDNDYIIYKELDDNKYYVAKKNEKDQSLNTEFNSEEIKLCNEVFKEALQWKKN